MARFASIEGMSDYPSRIVFSLLLALASVLLGACSSKSRSIGFNPAGDAPNTSKDPIVVNPIPGATSQATGSVNSGTETVLTPATTGSGVVISAAEAKLDFGGMYGGSSPAALDFGGFWGYVGGSPVTNPATGAMSCPDGYTSQHVYGTVNVDWPMYFCYRLHTTGSSSALFFGGMWGYVNGSIVANPATNAASCPTGYAQHSISGAANVDWPTVFCYAFPASGTVPKYDIGGVTGYVAGAPITNVATSAYSCPAGYAGQQIRGHAGVDYPFSFCYRQAAVAFNNPATQAQSCPAGYAASSHVTNEGLPVVACTRTHIAATLGLYDFGGMYGQIAGVVLNNPATGGQSCPTGYQASQVSGQPGSNTNQSFCYRPQTAGVESRYRIESFFVFAPGSPSNLACVEQASVPFQFGYTSGGQPAGYCAL